MRYQNNNASFSPSGISINTSFLCRNNCIYCYAHNLENRNEQVDIDEVFNDLVRSNLHQYDLPILINNSAADMFDPTTAPQAMKLMERIVAETQHKKLATITKEYISPDNIARLNKMNETADITVFFTYGALPRGYENLVDDRREYQLNNLAYAQFRKILYVRPIIIKDGVIVNDLEKAAAHGKHADALCYSYARIDDNIKALDGANLLPASTGKSYHESRKPNAALKGLGILKETGKPVFNRTSCALSYFYGQPDYNARWADRQKFGCQTCPHDDVCAKKMHDSYKITPEIEQIKQALNLGNIKGTTTGGYIFDTQNFSSFRLRIFKMLTRSAVFIEHKEKLWTPEQLTAQYKEFSGEPGGNTTLNQLNLPRHVR